MSRRGGRKKGKRKKKGKEKQKEKGNKKSAQAYLGGKVNSCQFVQ